MNNQKKTYRRGASFYVWHCKNGGKTPFCQHVSRCKGTQCEQYNVASEDSAALDKEFRKRKGE